MLAVQAVSSEPVSADFPVKQGINREFSQFSADFDILEPFSRVNSMG
jgi:hypothetical protein